LALEGEFHTPNLGHEFFPGGDKSPTADIPGRDGLWLNDFAGGLFAVDRLMLIRLLMIVILALFFYVAMRRPKIIPRGVQNVAEIGLDFVRVNIAEEILGKKEGRRFLPVITTIFFVVLIGNLPSVIPFLNVSPNARIGMPIILAAVAYIAMIYAGVKRYGFGKFMKSSLVIPNLPPALHILVVPIEFFSTFILRPVTLTIRLMANMLAGHIILVLLFSATNFFFWQLNGWTVLSVGTLVFGLAFMLFEMLIIFLQAYIFSLLTAVYIELSLHADEH
jgi:F-type H+-transporting ATPase subunit a